MIPGPVPRDLRENESSGRFGAPPESPGASHCPPGPPPCPLRTSQGLPRAAHCPPEQSPVARPSPAWPVPRLPVRHPPWEPPASRPSRVVAARAARAPVLKAGTGLVVRNPPSPSPPGAPPSRPPWPEATRSPCGGERSRAPNGQKAGDERQRASHVGKDEIQLADEAWQSENSVPNAGLNPLRPDSGWLRAGTWHGRPGRAPGRCGCAVTSLLQRGGGGAVC